MNPVLERWETKLTNWALWYCGTQARVGGCAYDGEYGESAPRPPPPLVGAAMDTDALVRKLSMRHFAAVKARYVWTGTLEQNAAELGIHVDTLANQVIAAKFRLDDLEQERERDKVRAPNAIA